MPVIVAVVLQFQSQRLPRCLVLNAAEQRGRPPEIAGKREIAALTVICLARVEYMANTCQRIAQVAAPADITPTQAEISIERTGALDRDQIFP